MLCTLSLGILAESDGGQQTVSVIIREIVGKHVPRHVLRLAEHPVLAGYPCGGFQVLDELGLGINNRDFPVPPPFRLADFCICTRYCAPNQPTG